MVPRETIYLDYNASTPAAPEVVEVMMPWISRPANASSAHRPGRHAAAALAQARDDVGRAVGAAPARITFTSGATESNNLVFNGLPMPGQAGRTRLLVLETEHKAVLEAARGATERGWQLDLLPVQANGLIDLDALDALLGEDVHLVSVQLVNNETGVIQPLAEVSHRCHGVGAVVHTDATQALGKVPLDLLAIGADLASFSSHKVYGPQGVGALYQSRTGMLTPSIFGGGQENGFRPGTENLAGAVGFGAAAKLAVASLQPRRTQAQRQTALLAALLSELVPGVKVNVPLGTPRVPNTLSLRVPGADAEALVAHTPGVAFSAGSACTSMVPGPSHVLTAMLNDRSAATECVRLSTGWPTIDDEIHAAAAQLAASVTRVRSMSLT